MDRAEVSERFKKVASDKLGIAEVDVEDNASFESLGGDSLDIVELVMGVEEEFDIEIPDEDQGNLKTVGETIDYIHQKVK